MQVERYAPEAGELAAAFATLQTAAQAGVRITITLEREPGPRSGATAPVAGCGPYVTGCN